MLPPNAGQAIDLADFFQRSFAPARLAGKNADYVHSYGKVIDWLRRTLKRAPALADLTPRNLVAVQKRVRKQGHSQSHVRTIRTRLASLAIHAWRLGLLSEYQTTGLIRSRKRLPWARNLSGPAGSLLGAFAAVRGSLSMGKKRAGNASSAIRYFDQMLERPATLGDVTEVNLRGLSKFILAEGRAAIVAQDYISALRGFCRHLEPQRFPDARTLYHRGQGVGDPRLPAPPPEPGTVRHFYERVYRPLKHVGVAPTTVRDFDATLRTFTEHYGRELRLEEQTDCLAADHFEWLLRRGILPVTVNGHRAIWFAIWRFAHKRGLVAAPPAVGPLKVHLDPPDAWSETEAKAIFDAPLLIEWRRPVAGIPAGRWWRAILLVGYWTGLRRGSLLKLHWDNVDLANGWLTVHGKAMKNKRGQRFRLGQNCLEALQAICQPARELIFPWSQDVRNLDRHFFKILKAAGVAKSTRRTETLFHKLRRTVATLAATHKGLEAACDLLGHSSSETTRRYIDQSKLPGQDATEFLPHLS